ncbi:MAG: ExbD/TolR family protein [Gammaproteobacteria bacterium]|jgi:biopolymer transport protein ExbD|tara:strand:- start:1063 stop:1512 length:450 start_codon:yes stop_codon:yes gene_type:complete
MSGQLRSSRRRKNTISAGLKDRIMGKRSGQEENVIPMINIIFLLLLYFMIVGNLQPDYDIVPPASTRQALPSPEVATVAVDQDGSLRFEGRPVTSVALKAELAAIAGIDKLKIYADAKVSALVVSKIMKAASEAGVLKFILITQQRTGG